MLLCQLFLAVLCMSAVNADFYSAMAGMEELFNTEALMMKTIQEYISEKEVKLHKLRSHLSDYVEEYDEASQDVNSYLSNPISAYLLVKRLTSDWKEVKSHMNDTGGIEIVRNLTDKLPTEDDLSGAAAALIRLQDTYKLNTSSVARGELNGIKFNVELKAHDCYELGRQAYNSGDDHHTVLWMTEALNRHEQEENQKTSKSDILGYLAFSTYKEGDIESALHLTEELLSLVPNHSNAQVNRKNFIAELEAINRNKELRPEFSVAGITKTLKTIDEQNDIRERELYEMLCRGDINIGNKLSSRLKCRYVHKGNPFLRLAPLKEEEFYLKPRILLYHDVIYDSEIEAIKKLALPKFKRASVVNFATGVRTVAPYRVSKSAFLKGEDYAVLATLDRRSSDIAGLNGKSAEETQVGNYGIGGQYETHSDFANGKSVATNFDVNGDRIATVLYYMTDVLQGGATVFPRIKVAVKPVKGTAAFWFNLHKDGRGDHFTRHAGCPVLSGSKWVSNKWFHERGEDQHRPCDLTPDSPTEEKFSP